jgi:hypothetical protein
MRKSTPTMAFLLASCATVFAADMPAPMNTDEVKWGPPPPVISQQIKLAVISGNPMADGLYVIRLKLPANFNVPAHFHPKDEAVTVISGDFHIGMGDKLDKSNGVVLHAGGYAEAPAGMRHYGWTDGETVVQVHGMGPFGITYVNPEDDPSKGMASK